MQINVTNNLPTNLTEIKIQIEDKSYKKCKNSDNFNIQFAPSHVSLCLPTNLFTSDL